MPFTKREYIENIYDEYCSMMYGIIIKITNDEKAIETILTSVFKSLLKDDFFALNPHCIRAKIIKLTVQTACNQLNYDEHSYICFSEKTPQLNSILSHYSTSSNRELVNSSSCNMLLLREEFNSIRENLLLKGNSMKIPMYINETGFS